METKNRIYSGREHIFQKEQEQLRNWNTTERNKTLIGSFQNYIFSKGSGELRVAKLTSQLRRIVVVLNKDLDKVEKIDIENTIGYYNRQKAYSEATKSDYRRTIKQFYTWFKDEDERIYSSDEKTLRNALKLYKYIEKEIKISYKHERIDPSTIITDDEIDLVIEKGCKTIRDKALIKFLHETGVRVGELLNIRIKDIIINETHATIIVDGKTGKRNIPIINSLPYIIQYLEVHPFKNDKESYLWIGESPKYYLEPIKHKGTQKIIYRAFEKVGLEHKRQNLHWFRHSRATLLAPKLTEAMLCTFMGWKIGSKQVRTYLHVNETQLQNAILELKGLKKEDHKELRIPQKCVCGTLNDTNSKYCYKCGKPLNVKVVMEDKIEYDEELQKSIELLIEISKNPVLLKKFEDFKKFKSKE